MEEPPNTPTTQTLVQVNNSMDLNFTSIHEIDFNFTQDEFVNSLDVWINKPHILNKRVSSVEPVSQFQTDHLTVGQIGEIGKVLCDQENCTEVVKNHLDCSDHGKLCVQVRRLIPRNLSYFDTCVEIVVQDQEKNLCLFYNMNSDSRNPSVFFPYMIHFDEDKHKLVLKVACEILKPNENKFETAKDKTEKDCNSIQTKTIGWLKDTLFPKLVKWAQAGSQNSDSILCQSSLQLVNMSEYSVLYNTLKQKYGQQITEIWPEVTDPSKFVYEDIAIASYLILLWGNSPTSYVDLGCGNGLLVHILNSEGHRGVGIDVRRRKIWDLYPATTVLKEDVITPSASTIFPDVDWIIGNHSDELTPWIPVITTRSHSNCKMFLLPCCAYQFNGRKYKRRNSKLSIYSDYLTYISRNVCADLCGFNVQLDRLRIPSTKRIAIVCQSRTYASSDAYRAVDERIAAFLKRLQSETNEGEGRNGESGAGEKEEKNGEESTTRDEIMDSSGKESTTSGEKMGCDCEHSTNNSQMSTNSCGKRAANGCEKSANKSEHCAIHDEESAKKRKTGPVNAGESIEEHKTDEAWMTNVKTRESKEQVKNCTQMDKAVEGSIVNIIVECVLRKQMEVNKSWAEETEYAVPLGDLVREIKSRDDTLLRAVSRQNGGLKTLIRNRHQVFHVLPQGVTFRRPQTRPDLAEEYRKKKPCWFQRNHPFKCPLDGEQCSFVHEELS